MFYVFSCTESDNHGLPTQVSCFSFASPKVGTQVFQRLTQKAEMDGSLRFLRSVNNKDPVTNVPKDVFLLCTGVTDVGCGCLMNTICQSNMYRHGGMELRCYRNGGFRLSHLPQDWWTFRCCPLFISDMLKLITRSIFLIISFLRCLTCLSDNFRKFHSWLLYIEWMDANKEELDKLYLDDLYEAVRNHDFTLVRRRY